MKLGIEELYRQEQIEKDYYQHPILLHHNLLEASYCNKT